MCENENIDSIYNLYEKRYNLTKLAIECGISEKEYKSLSSEDKFLLLSIKLKETNKINLASFFFGKLFEVTNNIKALIFKIDCLLELGEYEEALRYNNMAWELYLEIETQDMILEIEKEISYQKALILFYTEKYNITEWFCEECIIKFKSPEFYYLLCATFIALNNFTTAKQFYSKYCNKFGDQINFLLEVFVNLLNINYLEKALEFINLVYNITEKERATIINYINNYYSFNKNKSILKDMFEKEVNLIKILK